MDLSRENPQTLEMYGIGREPTDSYGRRCLFARRLIERGVRFVNVYHASWDHHSNLDTELKFNATMADQPIAALLKDLKEREATILRLYLGLDSPEPMTLEEIGAKLGITRERVRQIKEKALSRLRHVSSSKALESFLS